LLIRRDDKDKAHGSFLCVGQHAAAYEKGTETSSCTNYIPITLANKIVKREHLSKLFAIKDIE